MKAQIKLIIKNWKPNLFGNAFTKKRRNEMMENGFYSGSLWQDALLAYTSQDGWIPTEPNNNADATVFSFNQESDVEIRIVSRHGFGSIQANVSGSKGTKENKLKSLKKKIELLGENGMFALIDISNASTKGASVYLMTTSDFVKYFGDKKVKVSYPEFLNLVEKRCS
jgi:hypothetical protein